MKKTLLFLFVFVIICSLVPALPISASPNVLEVKWDYGYVGSMGNALGNENKLGSLGSPTTSYRHTNIVTIERAGTTIWFSEKGSGNSGFCARTGYSVSSWREVDGQFLLDTEGANYPGTDGISIGIAERSGDTITYTYTTSQDGEQLRFSFCIANDYDSAGRLILPTIYYEYTGLPGTFAEQCAADQTEALFSPDNTVTGFSWFDGYVGSRENDAFYVEEIRPYFNTYSYTGIIKVPKSGTMLSLTDPAFPYADGNVYVISSWKEAGATYVIESAGMNISGAESEAAPDERGIVTYSYTTQEDNELLRFCLNTNSAARPELLWEAPEGTYGPDGRAAADSDAGVGGDTVPSVIYLPIQSGEANTDTADTSPNIAGISALSLTGIAYFAGFALIKGRTRTRKSGKIERKRVFFQ